MQKALRQLNEIRLRRAVEVDGEQPVEQWLWFPDTAANRERLNREAELGNRLHGPETHWLEERQA